MDFENNIFELEEIVKTFCEERDWDKYHKAKDLSIGIITEASELLEHFRFKSEKEIEEMFEDREKKEKISEELADVFFFLLRFSQKYDINLSNEFKKKMEINKINYPIEKSKGMNKKYTEL
jgi:NTP pyrophosphatase (non-canonical NTP hydrolase)